MFEVRGEFNGMCKGWGGARVWVMVCLYKGGGLVIGLNTADEEGVKVFLV
jgi:hypothetical protein